MPSQTALTRSPSRADRPSRSVSLELPVDEKGHEDAGRDAELAPPQDEQEDDRHDDERQVRHGVRGSPATCGPDGIACRRSEEGGNDHDDDHLQDVRLPAFDGVADPDPFEPGPDPNPLILIPLILRDPAPGRA